MASRSSNTIPSSRSPKTTRRSAERFSSVFNLAADTSDRGANCRNSEQASMEVP
jgi:hypothetical protein